MRSGDVVLGVDFGTSNTAASLVLPDGRTRTVLFDGSPLLPSAVCVDRSTLLVGRTMKRWTFDRRVMSASASPTPR